MQAGTFALRGEGEPVVERDQVEPSRALQPRLVARVLAPDRSDDSCDRPAAVGDRHLVAGLDEAEPRALSFAFVSLIETVVIRPS
ncbi:MAG TPA: hypothetical protein VFA44_03745 [Gaiellaceae bacterium]|nr:hypothetical protein [Gaiellaceae bacterium]